MWSDPGHRIAFLPSSSLCSPSQPQQLSFQSYPKIAHPRERIHSQHCSFLPLAKPGTSCPWCSLCSTAGYHSPALCRRDARWGKRLGMQEMQGMQAARREGQRQPTALTGRAMGVSAPIGV